MASRHALAARSVMVEEMKTLRVGVVINRARSYKPTPSDIRRARYKRATADLPPCRKDTKRLIMRVLFKHGVSWHDVVSRRRRVTEARREICWTLAVGCSHLSYPALGRMIDRDHTTVLHHVQIFQILLREGRARALAPFGPEDGEKMMRGELRRMVNNFVMNQDRNARLFADHKSGIPAVELAEKYEITTSRVYTILRRLTAKEKGK